MKKISISLAITFIYMAAFSQSNYDHKQLFDPNFYPPSTNEYRSASGAPGVKYWQNHADYKINCTLDTVNHKVSGQVEIVYTNNSPDNLKFLWLQTDQNIYKAESRASATTTQTGGRWANASFTQGDVIKSISVELDGKKFVPDTIGT